MKKFINIFIALCMALTIASCGENVTPEISESASPSELTTPMPTAEPKIPEPATLSPSPSTLQEAEVIVDFDGKIAIVTDTIVKSEEEYYSAQQLVGKYGEDKVSHVTWPDKYLEMSEQGVNTIVDLGKDPEVKAIVINPVLPGCNAAIDKLHETRDDIFIVYCNPQENPADISERANLILIPDEIMMGPAMVQQAHKAGAKTFIYYSYPRHMAAVLRPPGRRELARDECKKLEIEFVEVTAPDPMGDIGLDGAQQFMLEDVPKIIEQYGKDTAFFIANCEMEVPVIKAVVDGGAIYSQPCHPSPFHGLPEVLGIDTPDISKKSDIEYVISETRRIIAEKGMTGRVSTWPVSSSMTSTNVAAEYAIKWLNGEVPKEEIDADVLKELMENYAGVPVSLRPFEDENGAVFENYLMFLMDYIVY